MVGGILSSSIADRQAETPPRRVTFIGWSVEAGQKQAGTSE